jgi:hypothetical protein
MLGIPRHRPIAQDHEAIDHNPLGDHFVAGNFHVAAGVVGAVARNVDGAARTLEGRALQLSGGKLDPAADRSAVGE